MGDSLTYDMYFRYDNLNDRLVAGGLYTTRDFTRADGYFWLAIDPDNATGAQSTISTLSPYTLIKNVEGKKLQETQTPGSTSSRSATSCYGATAGASSSPSATARWSAAVTPAALQVDQQFRYPPPRGLSLR